MSRPSKEGNTTRRPQDFHYVCAGAARAEPGHRYRFARKVASAPLQATSWSSMALSAWRQQAPRKDRKPIAWERAMETLRDALLLAQVVDHSEAVPGIT